MDLILWRHAEAEDGRGGDDLRRALTARGRAQAARMAAWLATRLPPATRILASPALRCQQTVAALGRPATTVAAIGSGGSAAALLAAAGWPDGGNAVLVVGHQPTLGEAAARAAGDDDAGWSLKKGAVCWLRHGPDGDVEVHAE
ncbi:MAG TPA: histidine phosphatase family protein, partial [Caldimonas sp.]|nr:histidine phosphatase family protein [Caldimonas sp.]